MEAEDVQFVTNLTWNSFTSLKTVKRMLLILRYVLSRYFLLYNLEVSFNFHLHDISTIECE